MKRNEIINALKEAGKPISIKELSKKTEIPISSLRVDLYRLQEESEIESIEKQGLDIDQRHMMLFADTITRKGELHAMGRHGISGEKKSVLGRAAFETQMKHLLKAAQKGETDPLKGVAETTIVGQEMPLGTGSVNLRMTPKKPSD